MSAGANFQTNYMLAVQLQGLQQLRELAALLSEITGYNNRNVDVKVNIDPSSLKKITEQVGEAASKADVRPRASAGGSASGTVGNVNLSPKATAALEALSGLPASLQKIVGELNRSPLSKDNSTGTHASAKAELGKIELHLKEMKESLAAIAAHQGGSAPSGGGVRQPNTVMETVVNSERTSLEKTRREMERTIDAFQSVVTLNEANIRTYGQELRAWANLRRSMLSMPENRGKEQEIRDAINLARSRSGSSGSGYDYNAKSAVDTVGNAGESRVDALSEYRDRIKKRVRSLQMDLDTQLQAVEERLATMPSTVTRPRASGGGGSYTGSGTVAFDMKPIESAFDRIARNFAATLTSAFEKIPAAVATATRTTVPELAANTINGKPVAEEYQYQMSNQEQQLLGDYYSRQRTLKKLAEARRAQQAKAAREAQKAAGYYGMADNDFEALRKGAPHGLVPVKAGLIALPGNPKDWAIMNELEYQKSLQFRTGTNPGAEFVMSRPPRADQPADRWALPDDPDFAQRVAALRASQGFVQDHGGRGGRRLDKDQIARRMMRSNERLDFIQGNSDDQTAYLSLGQVGRLKGMWSRARSVLSKAHKTYEGGDTPSQAILDQIAGMGGDPILSQLVGGGTNASSVRTAKDAVATEIKRLDELMERMRFAQHDLGVGIAGRNVSPRRMQWGGVSEDGRTVNDVYRTITPFNAETLTDPTQRQKALRHVAELRASGWQFKELDDPNEIAQYRVSSLLRMQAGQHGQAEKINRFLEEGGEWYQGRHGFSGFSAAEHLYDMGDPSAQNLLEKEKQAAHGAGSADVNTEKLAKAVNQLAEAKLDPIVNAFKLLAEYSATASNNISRVNGMTGGGVKNAMLIQGYKELAAEKAQYEANSIKQREEAQKNVMRERFTLFGNGVGTGTGVDNLSNERRSLADRLRAGISTLGAGDPLYHTTRALNGVANAQGTVERIAAAAEAARSHGMSDTAFQKPYLNATLGWDAALTGLMGPAEQLARKHPGRLGDVLPMVEEWKQIRAERDADASVSNRYASAQKRTAIGTLSDSQRKEAEAEMLKATQEVEARGVKTATELNERIARRSELEKNLKVAIGQRVAAEREGIKAEESSVGFVQRVGGKIKSLMAYSVAMTALYTTFNAIKQAYTGAVSNERESAEIAGMRGGSSLDERLRIKDETIQAAKDYGAALQDVFAITREFVREGLTIDEAMQRTRAVLMGTEALGLHRDVAREVLQANESISGGLTSGGEIMDKIAKVSSNNPVSADDMAAAIMRVAPIMSQMMPARLGQMDPMDAAMGASTAIIEKTRVSGQSAATSLSMIMGRLLSPAVGKQLQTNFGVMLGGSTPNEMRPVTDILTDLASRYKQLQDSGQSVKANALLQEVGGPRQVNATAALLSGWNRALEVATQSSTAFGEAQRKLAVEMDTNAKQEERLRSAWNGFTDRLLEFTHVVPILTTAFKGLAAFLAVPTRDARKGNLFGGETTDFDNKSIDSSDLVQDYRRQAASYAMTPQALRQAVAAAVLGAKRNVAGQDWFKAAGLSEDNVFNVDDGKTNRRLSVASTHALVDQLDKTVPGFKEVGDEAKRAAVALKLVSDTQAQGNVYLGIRVGDLQDRMSKTTESFSEQFAQAMEKGTFSSGIMRTGAYHDYMGFNHPATVERGRTIDSMKGFFSQQFGPDFAEAIGGKSGFHTSRGASILSEAVDAMDKMPDKIHNWGEALDYVTQKMLTFSPGQEDAYNAAASKVKRGTNQTLSSYEMDVAWAMAPGAGRDVAMNRANFDASIRQAMQRGFGVDHMAREAMNAQQGRDGLTLGGGSAFQQAVVQSMIRNQKDITDYLKTHGMSDEAKSFGRFVSVVGNDQNRQRQFADLLSTSGGAGTMKERLLDAMIQASVKFEQIRNLSGSYGAAGITYDPNRERESAARDLVQNLSGLRAQAHGDVLKSVLREHYISQSDIDPTQFTNDLTGKQMSGTDLRLTLQGAQSGLKAEQKAALARNTYLARKMLSELDTNDMSSMPKELKDWIADFQKNGVSGKNGVADLILNLPRLQAWADEFLKSMHDINSALDDELKAIKHKSDLDQQQRAFNRDRARATGDYNVRMADALTPYSSGALRFGNIASDRTAQLGIVEATYAATMEELEAKARRAADPDAFRASDEYVDTKRNAGYTRESGQLGANNAAMGAAQDLVLSSRLEAFTARQADLLDLLKQLISPMKDFVKGLLDDPRHFKGHRAAEIMVPQMASALNSRIASHAIESVFGDQTRIGKTLTNLFGMSDSMLQQETLRKGVYAGTIKALNEQFGPSIGITGGSTSAGAGATGAAGTAGMVAGALAAGGLSAGIGAIASHVRAGGFITSYDQMRGLSGPEMAEAIRTGKINKDGTPISGRQQAGMMMAGIAGQLGGSIISGRMHHGYNYGAEGSSFGSTIGGGLGMMVGGPVGAMLGSLLGGVAGGTLGGLFHKKLPPREAPEYVALEKIERNTRETITAVENSGKRLADLDTRFLNAPASFSVPGYRPMNVGSGMGGGAGLYQDNRKVDVHVYDATDPMKVAVAVQQVLSGDMRGAGTFLTMRTSS